MLISVMSDASQQIKFLKDLYQNVINESVTAKQLDDKICHNTLLDAILDSVLRTYQMWCDIMWL